jgi:hypothetical protein
MKKTNSSLGSYFGWAAVAGNVLGVLFLHQFEKPYRLSGLDGWTRDCLSHPTETVLSSFSFVIGLAALVIWVLDLEQRLPEGAGKRGAWVIALGAAVNAAGCFTPLVLALHAGAMSDPSLPTLGRALLGMTLSLDGFFNFSLGVGLVMIGLALRKTKAPKGLAWLALAGGAASFPASLQMIWDPAAQALLLSGPLWLFFIAWDSFRNESYQ